MHANLANCYLQIATNERLSNLGTLYSMHVRLDCPHLASKSGRDRTSSCWPFAGQEITFLAIRDLRTPEPYITVASVSRSLIRNCGPRFEPFWINILRKRRHLIFGYFWNCSTCFAYLPACVLGGLRAASCRNSVL